MTLPRQTLSPNIKQEFRCLYLNHSGNDYPCTKDVFGDLLIDIIGPLFKFKSHSNSGIGTTYRANLGKQSYFIA